MTTRFIAAVRARFDRVERCVGSQEYNIVEGEMFRSGNNLVRHDQVLFRDRNGLRRAGKVQIKQSAHTGEVVFYLQFEHGLAPVGVNYREEIIAEYRQRIPQLIVAR